MGKRRLADTPRPNKGPNHGADTHRAGRQIWTDKSQSGKYTGKHAYIDMKKGIITSNILNIQKTEYIQQDRTN